MATDYDTTQAAAAIYAESLLDLAGQAGQAEAVGEEMAQLFDLWHKQPNFAAMMCSAAIDEDARRESIRRIFGGNRVSTLVLNTLLVLNDKRRAMILPEVCKTYLRKLDQRLVRSEVFVTTASPLDDAQRGKIREQVKRLIDREPVLVERIDPDLLGGLRIQVADRVYDASVRRRLRDIRGGLYEAIGRHLRSHKIRFVTEG